MSDQFDLFAGLCGVSSTGSLGPLKDKFLLPPFSVLDTKQVEWRRRKGAWLNLGIRGEMGRSGIGGNKAYRDHKWCVEKNGNAISSGDGTSIFDPVLCELIYSWFCPVGGQVVDPFAGGSVRGVVAGVMGRKYWGCDIREEQITENRGQAEMLPVSVIPEWVIGDSRERLAAAPKSDLVFSCPPYGAIEKYSTDAKDLSNMDWSDFLSAYRDIIRLSVERMKTDSFACFVVGDFRDSNELRGKGTGYYRNFVSETISAFTVAGAGLYNEAILVTPVGSGAMRATAQFANSRKLVKMHQNVLVFCNGDPVKATNKCKV